MNIDHDELQGMLGRIKQKYGYDFSQYAEASLKRRVKAFMAKLKCETLQALEAKILSEQTFMDGFLHHMSITVSEMFRDPTFFAAVRELVIPKLETYPYFKIWHAGCSTGEEIYSMAICLQEAGLLDRARIYATDINPEALNYAKRGIYPVAEMKANIRNYRQSNGTGDFTEFYHAKHKSAKMASFLSERVTFATHNLVSDGAFGEMNVILCRNVLIYFNRDLQNTVLTKFRDSLGTRGILCLGSKESLRFSDVAQDFESLDDRNRIYERKF